MRTNDHFTLRIKAVCIHLDILVTHTIRSTSSQRLMVHGNTYDEILLWIKAIEYKAAQFVVSFFPIAIFKNSESMLTQIFQHCHFHRKKDLTKLRYRSVFCLVLSKCSFWLGFMNHTQICVISLIVFMSNATITRCFVIVSVSNWWMSLCKR